MKVRNQKREGNKVVIEVEAPYADFEQAAEKALIRASKEVKLPGFRPGKAPKALVEKALAREAVEYQGAQELISDLYPKIIDEAKLQPVDYPSIEIVEQAANKPFVFKIAVDVYPEVKLGKYKGLKVVKKKSEVTEDDLVKILGNLQSRFAQTKAEGKQELLPLDDEFAKKISRHGTLAELKEEVRSSYQQEKAAEAEADVKNQLVAGASAEAKLEVPKAMVEREIDEMLNELRGSLAQSGMTLEDYLKGTKKEEKGLREEMKKAAEIRVRGKIVLKAVAETEKIAVAPDEISAELKAMAGESGQEPAEVEKRLGAGVKEFVSDYLLRKKALDFLLEKANLKEEGEK